MTGFLAMEGVNNYQYFPKRESQSSKHLTNCCILLIVVGIYFNVLFGKGSWKCILCVRFRKCWQLWM